MTSKVLALLACLLILPLGSAHAEWTRNILANPAGAPFPDVASADTTWNIFWWGDASRSVNATWGTNGSTWNTQGYANNLGQGFNNIACDSNWHLTWYSGSDGFIWAVWWNGTAWVFEKIGTNQNNASQLCVDSDYHILWYVASDLTLWAVYWNGSSWIEGRIDDTPRNRNSKLCGIDSTNHYLWTVSVDRRSLLVTYLSGNAWATATVTTLPAGEIYGSICANPADGHCYQLVKADLDSATLRVQQTRVGGSVWVTEDIWTQGVAGNKSANSQYVLPPQGQQFFCYLSGGTLSFQDVAPMENPVTRFCTYSPGARSWANGTIDGKGLPMAILYGGRAILCADLDAGTTNQNGGALVLWNENE